MKDANLNHKESCSYNKFPNKSVKQIANTYLDIAHL